MDPKPFAQRLHGLRNYQSDDFWAMVFARPMTILLLLPLADRPGVTPDRITLASGVLKLLGMVMLVLLPGYSAGVAAAVLINLGLVADNMDGTLARYRRGGTYYGYFVDKALDFCGLALLFLAMGLRAHHKYGTVESLLLPTMGFMGAAVAAYTKWVCNKVLDDISLKKAALAGQTEGYVAKRIAPYYGVEPPTRNLGDWVRFFWQAVKSIKNFNEVDVYFFLALALVLGREWVFTGVMAGVYALGLVAAPLSFYAKIRKAEQDLRNLQG